MNSQDPFGRPQPGNPFQHAPRRRRFLTGPLLVGFLVFDLFVAIIIGSLFMFGAFGPDDDDVVVIPPTAAEVAKIEADEAEDLDDEGGSTSVVTRESGTSTIVTPDEPEQKAAPAGPAPAGLNETSLLRAENLRPALASAKSVSQGGKITNLRLDATRLNVQVATAGGDLIIINVSAGEEAEVITKVEGGASTRDGVSYAQIKATAPQRLVRAAGADGTGSKAVNYLVIQPSLAPWALHTMGGQRVAGDANGNPE